MGLFFSRKSKEARTAAKEEKEAKRLASDLVRRNSTHNDPRFEIVHRLMDEARIVDSSIPTVNESLLSEKECYAKFRKTEDREAGKTNKFPEAFSFYLYKYDDTVHNGTHGDIYYLKDRTPAKAVVNTWLAHVHYHIQAKLIDGELALSFIDRSTLPEAKKTRVYDYRDAV